MKAGGLGWLLRHELRLQWRELASKTRRRSLLWGTAVVGGILACWLWLEFGELRAQIGLAGLPQEALWFAAPVWLLSALYAFCEGINQSLTALFDRGDLDLLLSAPISSETIFASRLLGVAVGLFLGFMPLVVPISILAVLVGLPQLLGLYPALASITLSAASLAMLLTLGLVRWLGVERARTVAQGLSLTVFVLIFLGSQFFSALSRAIPRNNPWFSAGGPLAADSWLWLPVRATFSDPAAVVFALGTGLVLFWVSIRTLSTTFVVGAQHAPSRGRRRGVRPLPRFDVNLNYLVLAKEWRLLRRNPLALSRTALQVVLVLPLLFALYSAGVRSAPAILGPAAVLIGCQLAAALVNIGASCEEAPDLLNCAPVAGELMRILKLLAALIPTWLLFLPLYLLLGLRGGRSWWLLLAVFLIATTSTALVRFWNIRPGSGLERGRQNPPSADLVLSGVEMVLALAWPALAFAGATQALPWSLTALLAVGSLMALAGWRTRVAGSAVA